MYPNYPLDALTRLLTKLFKETSTSNWEIWKDSIKWKFTYPQYFSQQVPLRWQVQSFVHIPWHLQGVYCASLRFCPSAFLLDLGEKPEDLREYFPLFRCNCDLDGVSSSYKNNSDSKLVSCCLNDIPLQNYIQVPKVLCLELFFSLTIALKKSLNKHPSKKILKKFNPFSCFSRKFPY